MAPPGPKRITLGNSPLYKAPNLLTKVKYIFYYCLQKSTKLYFEFHIFLVF